jgi:hypothetical protein
MSPKGYHDAANCSVVEGWACDPNNYQQPLQIHFYQGGLAGRGGTYVGATTANISRADLQTVCGGNGGHGFSFSLPESLRTGSNQSIYAYAINIGAQGSNVLLTNSPKTVTCAPTPVNPTGYHDSANCSVVEGWACDPSNFQEPLQIHFYADNLAGSGTFVGATTANLSRADVASSCGGNGGHGFSFPLPPSLRTGTNRSIYAYAINTGVGSNVLLTQSPKTINCAVPPPNNITASCSTDSKNLTVSWDNAPGYDTVYFRVAPSSNTADGSLHVDNFYGNTRTTAITPGVPYSYWIHTSNGGTPSVAVSGTPITCAVPPPTNITTSCSEDGKNLTISWNNAP